MLAELGLFGSAVDQAPPLPPLPDPGGVEARAARLAAPVDEAMAAFRERRYATALDGFDAVLALDPDHGDARAACPKQRRRVSSSTRFAAISCAERPPRMRARTRWRRHKRRSRRSPGATNSVRSGSAWPMRASFIPRTPPSKQPSPPSSRPRPTIAPAGVPARFDGGVQQLFRVAEGGRGAGCARGGGGRL